MEYPASFTANSISSGEISMLEVIVAFAFSALAVTEVTPGIDNNSLDTLPSQCPQVIPLIATVISISFPSTDFNKTHHPSILVIQDMAMIDRGSFNI